MKTPDRLLTEFPSLLAKLEVCDLKKEVIQIMIKYSNQFRKISKANEEDLKLIQKISEFTGIRSLSVRCRHKDIVEARQLAMYFIRENHNTGLKVIGSYFGLHHSTVIHAINTVERLCGVDKAYKEIFDELDKILQND